MGYRHWRIDEINYLEDYWGAISIKRIAKRLGRSINGVKIKAQRLGLSDPRFYVDGITIHQLMMALNMDYRKHHRWVEKLGLPVKEKVFAIKNKIKFITYQDFWNWAEGNKREINWGKVEPYALGAEPSWVSEWRKKDYTNRIKNRGHNDRWTSIEEQRLMHMLKAYKYTYTDISKVLNRSEAAIRRKIRDLRLKQRPIRKNAKLWTNEQTKALVYLYKNGYSLEEIGEEVKKSALAVRGKLERMEII